MLRSCFGVNHARCENILCGFFGQSIEHKNTFQTVPFCPPESKNSTGGWPPKWLDGAAALLTVNAGPDMADCCLDGRFQSLVLRNAPSCNAPPPPPPSSKEEEEDGGRGEGACAAGQSLPDPASLPHTAALRAFYASAVGASPGSSSPGPGRCSVKSWSTGGFRKVTPIPNP